MEFARDLERRRDSVAKLGDMGTVGGWGAGWMTIGFVLGTGWALCTTACLRRATSANSSAARRSSSCRNKQELNINQFVTNTSVCVHENTFHLPVQLQLLLVFHYICSLITEHLTYQEVRRDSKLISLSEVSPAPSPPWVLTIFLAASISSSSAFCWWS